MQMEFEPPYTPTMHLRLVAREGGQLVLQQLWKRDETPQMMDGGVYYPEPKERWRDVPIVDKE